MKKYLYLLVFILIQLCLPSTLLAQMASSMYHRDDYGRKNVIDTCEYGISYRYKFIFDTIKKLPYYDNQILEVGRKYTRYTSIFADKIDSVFNNASYKLQKNGADGINATKEIGLKENEEAQYEDVYMNYEKKGFLTVRIGLVQTEYIYEEEIPKFDWKIFADTTTIIGYKCMKATTTFRGREYIAWFTPFMPIKKGPWKFCGLPGLILKIGDTKNYFEWTAIGIEKSRNKTIDISKYDAITMQRTTRKKATSILHQRWRDPAGLITEFGNGPKLMSRDATGKLVPIASGTIKEAYIPIPELDLINYEK